MIMNIIVRFAKVDHQIHLSVRTRCILKKVKLGVYYNAAMKDWSALMGKGHTAPVLTLRESNCEEKRVENIDQNIYKNFKITCLQKDISVSQGINLALKRWLDKQK